MATRNVIKPFKLNTPSGVVAFEAGTQEIDDAILDHWFVKAHLEHPKAKADPESREPAGNQPAGDGSPPSDGVDEGKKADPNAKAGAGKKD